MQSETDKLTMRVKYWRTRRAMSIKQLAQISHVSSGTIVNIERRGTIPRGSVIVKLARALGVTVEEMWGKEGTDNFLHPTAAA